MLLQPLLSHTLRHRMCVHESIDCTPSPTCSMYLLMSLPLHRESDFFGGWGVEGAKFLENIPGTFRVK